MRAEGLILARRQRAKLRYCEPVFAAQRHKHLSAGAANGCLQKKFVPAARSGFLRAALNEIPQLIREIRSEKGLSLRELSKLLNTSVVSVDRWERGASVPSPEQIAVIRAMHDPLKDGPRRMDLFSSRGIRETVAATTPIKKGHLATQPKGSVFSRVRIPQAGTAEAKAVISAMLLDHTHAAVTASLPPTSGMSAGKNTYTYDAHTYHTKVPPQGIAELLKHYLPAGGVVLDPFAGSGMTGVAAQVLGLDSILNELSPAAAFIAHHFTRAVDPTEFEATVSEVLAECADLRNDIYKTTCRECGKKTELIYTVWSSVLECVHCKRSFVLWDHCRKYGARVKEHKLLKEFPCPHCGKTVRKSRLKRLDTVPVQVGYKCCGSKTTEVMHPPTDADRELIATIDATPPPWPDYYPKNELPEGVNLRQPCNHGITRVDLFYTKRNLAAMNALWHAIHRVKDPAMCGFLAFVFTSLYQRVTRLSEFRFWGGSGNTPRFNVPMISNEANVFLTFKRKAKAICDHLRATAQHYSGRTIVLQGSALNLEDIGDESIDFIFTDPPFGASINYSEMNILWESWLGVFTDNRDEAIINKVQNKDVGDYQRLMTAALSECHRVLRSGHWMLLVFMNSSADVWQSLNQAVSDAGFAVQKVDIFDKQHGTFKQFVSENTAGCDLVLHCQKVTTKRKPARVCAEKDPKDSILAFLNSHKQSIPQSVFHHVDRGPAIDHRQLYSLWMAETQLAQGVIDFAAFREIAISWAATQPK